MNSLETNQTNSNNETEQSVNAINLSKNTNDQTENFNTQYDNANTQQQTSQYQQETNQYQQESQYQQQNMGYTQNNYENQQYADIVTPDKLNVEPAIACILSCVVVGLGQMINGQIEKGLALLVGGGVAISIIALVTCGFGAILSPFLIVVSAVDAYKCARKLQMGQPIGKYEFNIFN